MRKVFRIAAGGVVVLLVFWGMAAFPARAQMEPGGMMQEGQAVPKEGEAADMMSGHEMMHEMMEHMMGAGGDEAHGHDQRSAEKPWNQMNPMMAGDGGVGMFSGFGGIGMIFGLLFWVLVIAALFAGVKWLFVKTSSSTGEAQKSREAVEILKERYARGEIDKKEFEERLNAIKNA